MEKIKKLSENLYFHGLRKDFAATLRDNKNLAVTSKLQLQKFRERNHWELLILKI